MTLYDDLLHEIRLVAERPTLDQLRERLDSREPVIVTVTPGDAVRAERDRR